MDSSTMDSSITNSVVQGVEEQTSLFAKFWHTINWNQIIKMTISAAIQIIFFLALFFIVRKLGNLFIERTFKKYRAKKSISPNRLNTLNYLTQNLFQGILGFLVVYAILSILGVPVGSLLAGAGVIGLALSLGAQGFVSDIVNGFFILLEKQIDIGDVVELDEVSGTVVDVNLKTTQVKSFDGTLNFIPNRYITIVSNKSREDMRVMIEIRLYPNSDMEVVNQVIQSVNARMVPEYPQITEEPTNSGLIDLGSGQTGIRIIMYTLNGQQYAVQYAFFQEYLNELTKAGIKIPIHQFNITQP
ncbi:mechanosensitive ion channel family protein [Pisciglobus halotolerans]|uniref:Small conductance mechanosensitive channel n=1 Tax=Pisciglobus halotolerans TaxID=745365 RepID=A0A1I3CJF5_9LACT|nr:mechanosensitive ion channel family protein [Pisciglobus halotolerans]SFH74617.1 small conductance mechanosensitive channel [Pisciglobus halotolerans]